MVRLIPVPLKNWITPKSSNRDDAFRERTIRITIGLLFSVLLVAFVAQRLFFSGEWTLISLSTLVPAMWVVSVAAGIAVIRQQIDVASVLTVLTMYLGGVGVLAINGYNTSLTLPMLLLTLIVATLLLSARALLIIVASQIGCFILLGASQATGSATASSALINATINTAFVLGTAGLFLSRLRTEFDRRFKVLSESLVQVEVASEQLQRANQDLKISVERAERASRQAEVANQAKSQFLANMSHELRTPLNAINGYAEILIAGMRGPIDPKQGELVSYILENGKRQLNLVNNILDLSRIEAGADKTLATPFSPREITTKTIAKLESLAITKKISLTAEFTDAMPELVITDNQKVQGILINLIGNAIKFTKQGGVTVRIDSQDQYTWSITVTDTGIGIPEQELHNIFEMFQQVQNADSREHQGSGLGLTIVKKSVERLNGSVAVRSTIGVGSTFTVTLPRNHNTEK
jgi:signal transduction histidine kinase